MMDCDQFLAPHKPEWTAFQNAGVLILPIPYENTSSYGRGSANGPKAIIDASAYVEYYDEELDMETVKEVGICTLESLDFTGKINREAMQFIREEVRKCLDHEKFLVSLGAEHTITYPVFEAFRERYHDLSVLQLDAHSDLRESYEGNPLSHACVMARINESKPQIAQLGIRAQCQEEAQVIQGSANLKTVYAHTINSRKGWQEELFDHLSEDVYVTIDADAFDPSIIPGTGTPEPGGLDWYGSLSFLREIFTKKNVVGFDIVECSPRTGETISEFTLAKLLYKLIGYRYLNKFYRI